MAEKQFGGWYPNTEQSGKNMRWWGDYGWTTGSDPTGGAGPRQTTTPTQAPTGQVAPSDSLFSQYQAKLAPITAQSDQLLKDYYALAAQAPSFAQKLLDAIKQSGQYPSQAAMREEYAQNPNLTPMAIESLVSRRGQSTRGSIQDIIGRATGGFESDVASRQGMAQQAQQQRQNLLEEYGLARQEQQDILASTPKATQAGKQQTAMSNLIKRASEGVTLSGLVQEFGSSVDIGDIVKLYTGVNYYKKPPEEPWAQKILGTESAGVDIQAVDAYVNAINSGDITIANVPAAYKAEVIKRTSAGTSGEQSSPNNLQRLLETLKSRIGVGGY